ncbi:MAG: AmmeMemoRadiSam system radical SAM enzyme [Bacteroidia bacterium]|nr:AmmeMemoRadiSam system radical SAM enzyme [Bacteroidia bacterium]
MSDSKKIPKREFIKKGLLGIGGVIAGTYGIKSLWANTTNDMLNSNIFDSDDLGKFSKEASWYSVRGTNVKCELCPNGCLLKPGNSGACRTRINKDGKLYTIAYGNPCTTNIDPIEKKPLFHFKPSTKAYSIATAGCNLACLNCQNWDISQKSPKEVRTYDQMPAKVVEETLKNKCDSIAYTYTEPISFYEYMFDTAKLAHDKGIKNVFISNGYINEKPLRSLAKYLDAANINLKSFKEEIYNTLNSGSLQPILDTLLTLKEEKVWLEITNLVIPSWTDDMDMIKKMCEWLVKNNLHEYPLHFSKFVPLYKLTHLPVTPVSTLEKARKIAMDAGIKYIYIGNVPGHEAENTFCPKCKKMIIERKGFYILNNHIKDNKCEYCSEKISGVWK